MNLEQMQKPAQKQATPQQQEQFDLILGRCRQLMGETGQAWVAAMKKDPVRAAVSMGVQVVREVATMSDKAGSPVDPVVLIHVGLTLIKDIAGLANDGGMVPDEQLEDYIHQVTQMSLAEYMRLDADEGLLQKAEQKLKGDPATPDDSQEHEGAESADFEQQEKAVEQEPEDEMEMELQRLRQQKGGMK
jgi:hypothetical protein